MEVRYDEEIDAVYIGLQKGEYEISEEVGDGIVVDVSKDGKIIGIEILDASEKFSDKIFKNLVAKN